MNAAVQHVHVMQARIKHQWQQELRLLYLYFEEEGGLGPVVVLQR